MPFPYVAANLGMAIAARIPIMTVTMSTSISVKPFRWRA
jgi:hypothetical protein